MNEKIGCGKPATRICFRGPKRRLWLCGACLYEGSGKVAPYETGEDDPEKRVPGRYVGPARKCGEEILP